MKKLCHTYGGVYYRERDDEWVSNKSEKGRSVTEKGDGRLMGRKT